MTTKRSSKKSQAYAKQDDCEMIMKLEVEPGLTQPKIQLRLVTPDISVPSYCQTFPLAIITTIFRFVRPYLLLSIVNYMMDECEDFEITLQNYKTFSLAFHYLEVKSKSSYFFPAAVETFLADLMRGLQPSQGTSKLAGGGVQAGQSVFRLTQIGNSRTEKQKSKRNNIQIKIAT